MINDKMKNIIAGCGKALPTLSMVLRKPFTSLLFEFLSVITTSYLFDIFTILFVYKYANLCILATFRNYKINPKKYKFLFCQLSIV